MAIGNAAGLLTTFKSSSPLVIQTQEFCLPRNQGERGDII